MFRRADRLRRFESSAKGDEGPYEARSENWCWRASASRGRPSAPAQAKADDVFGGFYGHGLGVAGREQDSFDTMVGYRTDRIGWLWWLGRPEAHAILSINDKYSTDFAAIGLDWRGAVLQQVVHPPRLRSSPTPPARRVCRPRTSAGLTPIGGERAASPLLRPVSISAITTCSSRNWQSGYNFNKKWAIEASYVHLSNGQILHQGKNQGLDDLGLRLNYHFR